MVKMSKCFCYPQPVALRKKKTLITFGCFLLLSTHSYSVPLLPRQLWYFQDLVAFGRGTILGDSRSGVEVRGIQFQDTISLAAASLLDLRSMELKLQGSRRVFLDLSQQGTLEQQGLSGQLDSLSFSLARYFVSHRSVYGRMGAGAFFFVPSQTFTYHFEVETGVLGMEKAWDFTWEFHFLANDPAPTKTLVFQGGIAKHLEKLPFLSIGGHASLLWNLQPAPALNVTQEHLLLNVGPVATWHFKSSQLKWGPLWRIYVDESSMLIAGAATTATLSSSSLWPDFTVSWCGSL